MTATKDTAAVLTAGLSQIGVPYSFGGEDPNTDFDCSGLMQWAYAQAGVVIPRTSEEQWQQLTHISAAEAEPGDLVFMAGSDGTMTSPGHVGMVLGNGLMLDAPHTGANVQIEPIPSSGVVGYAMAPGVVDDASVSSAGKVTAGAPAVAGTGILGQIIDNPLLDPVGATVKGTVGAVSDVAGLESDADAVLSKLTSAAFWQRVGMGALGVGLFVAGLVVFFDSTATGKKTVGDATDVAAVAAVA
jgi:hypothetical protein